MAPSTTCFVHRGCSASLPPSLHSCSSDLPPSVHSTTPSEHQANNVDHDDNGDARGDVELPNDVVDGEQEINGWDESVDMSDSDVKCVMCLLLLHVEEKALLTLQKKTHRPQGSDPVGNLP